MLMTSAFSSDTDSSDHNTIAGPNATKLVRTRSWREGGKEREREEGMGREGEGGRRRGRKAKIYV